MNSSKLRSDLVQCFEAALARVRGRDAVRGYLAQHALAGRVCLAAVGKAAASMSLGALDVLGDSIAQGLVVTKRDHLDPELSRVSRIRCMESDHPVPSEASLAAGQALLDFFDGAPADATMLVLISGGASSLAEVLSEGWTLQSLKQLTSEMLSTGLTITQMNRIRKMVSRIKGGRLAQHLGDRKALVLVISDVPGDDPAVIGSGMMSPTITDTHLPKLPQTLEGRLKNLESLPGTDHPAFRNVELHVIAKLDDAKQSAADAARQLGYRVQMHSEFLEGEAGPAGERLAKLALDNPGVVHVFGGEPTVTLPANPGRGGRNQHLALAAAAVLAGRADAMLLSGGTDGTDGPTEDAGAIVDGGTLNRGRAAGMDEAESLRRSDSGHFLEASGDLIRTGPTGTNVMDIVLAYAAGR